MLTVLQTKMRRKSTHPLVATVLVPLLLPLYFALRPVPAYLTCENHAVGVMCRIEQGA
jgi:hypothetical protein